ncbi:hypothetical protein JD844_010058 [Phrynosoma platyrhinos]|uniref:Alpha-2-macroglobulin bait region domain-containing protein n=1 Tax=Phrynosoma platyrhinos TaxID=52577 RepID=A0ABQ7TG98_PHRPL|nr:hypothetical protein JD844_010058 [Phrynosoma platyrhinos]
MQVVSKGGIVQEGTHNLSVKNGEAKGVFLLNLVVDVESAPLAHLVVYTDLRNEVIAHSADFTVENCFLNKVYNLLPVKNLQGYQYKSHNLDEPCTPFENLVVYLPTDSIHEGDTYGIFKVYNLLPVKNLQGYQYKSHNLDDPCTTFNNLGLCGLTNLVIPSCYEGDTYDIFKVLCQCGDVEVLLTWVPVSIVIYEQRNNTMHVLITPYFRNMAQTYSLFLVCLTVNYGMPDYGGVIPPEEQEPPIMMPMRVDTGVKHVPQVDHRDLPQTDYNEPVETMRSIFPETWMWFTTTLE